ncbi:MAG TPA: hypothetical protein VFV34_12250 [Blastocatellia bacterium]|nr:hypothetical protein [Blastocatellia bacterium]
MSLFLNTADEAEEHRLLEQIVIEHARPLLTQIILAKLRLSVEGRSRHIIWQDSEDIVGDLVLDIVKRLLAAKADPDRQPLEDLTTYVAVAAHNAFYTYLRRKHPERWRLKDKLRYVLTYKTGGFALWRGNQNKWWCGLEEWRVQNVSPCPAGRVKKFREERAELSANLIGEGEKDNLPKLVNEVFQWAGGPIQFGDLVDLVADVWSIADTEPTIVYHSQELGLLRSVPVEGPSVATTLEDRQYLERVWKEVCELPVQQRRALLFNLRDARGHDMTAMFARTRVAMLPELAEGLELTVEEFAKLSSGFPMEDSLIAEYLGLTRQQVINLRISARRRLARRMKKMEGSE